MLKKFVLSFLLVFILLFGLFASEHTHSFSYVKDFQTIKAYCTNTEEADDCEYQGIENAVSVILLTNKIQLMSSSDLKNLDNEDISWSSSDSDNASVDPQTGTVYGHKAGTSEITATTTDGLYKKATINAIVYEPVTEVELNKSSTTLYVGGASETLEATVLPSDATYKEVIWKSSDKSIATVDSTGKVSPVYPGNATISVKTFDGRKSAICDVTVIQLASKITLNKSSISLTPKSTVTLTATVTPDTTSNKEVTWTSSNTSVATVTSAGVVTGTGIGTTTIKATTKDGTNLSASCTVTVSIPVTGVSLNKTSTTIITGYSETLTATIEPADATNKSVTWSSSNTSVAKVTSSGKVTGVKEGSATITVKTADGGYTKTCSVTVINNYLAFTANTAGSTVTPKFVSGTWYYSTNNGSSWTQGSNSGTKITLSKAGSKVLLKGTDCTTSSVYHFEMTGSIAASGHVTSLTNGTGGDVALTKNCYNYMFYNCSVLTTAPGLPSTTLAEACYYAMFWNCTSLKTASALPATKMEKNCYYLMFGNCSALKTAPALPAKILAEYCYGGMFNGSGLTSTPNLPATNLADFCYYQMFARCESLTTVCELKATTMVKGCYYSMFNSCTALKQAPALPATTLAEKCYMLMFWTCTSLKTAPALNVTTTLPYACYHGMFQYCSSLKITNSSSQSGATKIFKYSTENYDATACMFANTGGSFTNFKLTAGQTYYYY